MNLRRNVMPTLLLLVLCAVGRAQQLPDAAAENAQQARAVLESMVKALGGDAWLNLKNSMRAGRAAAFYRGKPSGATTLYWEFHRWPDQDRYEFTKHRDVLQIITGRKGWEVTYKGKAPMTQAQLEEFLRRRDHSIETVAHSWMNDPKAILLYEGQHLVGRHLAEQVTVISPSNEAVTILTDKQTHLPLRRSFTWRDPVYHDKNTDAEEYDDYHDVNGLPTPYSVTRYKNEDMTSQRFLTEATYNQNLPDSFWNPDEALKRVKK